MGLPPELAFVFGDISTVFHRTRLVSREMIAENTLELSIERPEGFVFAPGQNTTISLPGAHADDLREFSIASAPYEQDIVIAMRARNSNFKHACYALKPGDPIMVRDAAGSLWEQTDSPQVWLSGGIGITPFRSIIRELVHAKAPVAVTHIHSDHSVSTVPYRSEFESISNEETGYSFKTVFTQEAARGEEKGRLTAKMINALAPAFAQSDLYIVGTEPFVAAMRASLAELGVDAVRIHTEKFEGYARHNA